VENTPPVDTGVVVEIKAMSKRIHMQVGDRVKWNGKTTGEVPMPSWLTKDLIGYVFSINKENEYPITVMFDATHQDSFLENELELVS
jgi:hypothetical protein